MPTAGSAALVPSWHRSGPSQGQRHRAEWWCGRAAAKWEPAKCSAPRPRASCLGASLTGRKSWPGCQRRMVELILTGKSTNPIPSKVGSAQQTEIESIRNEMTEESGEGSVSGAAVRRDPGADRTTTPTPRRSEQIWGEQYRRENKSEILMREFVTSPRRNNSQS